jgi:uncharacterized protein (DUF2147 family)
MKKLYIVAALLMAATSAHAGNGISFQINGERIRVEAPRNCNALSCIRITAPGYSGTVGNIDLKGIGSKNKDDDDFADTTPTNPASAPASVPVQANARQPAAPVATYVAPPAPTAVASTAPVQADVAAPVRAPVAVAAPIAPPAPVAAAPVSDPNSPLGVWATEENKGNVRIEQCGPNLCGYAAKSGEKILISMKPEGSKWTGRIHDPDSGRNYDSTMAMKGTMTLRVQGCAFGGMFCGGQTWKRVS